MTTEATVTTATSDLLGTTTAAPAAAPTEAAPQVTDTDGDKATVKESLTPDQNAETTEQPALKVPGKDATPEEWQAFYKQIGAPDSAEAYELPTPEGDDGQFAKTAAEWFKDAGVLPQQAQILATKYNEFAAAQQAAQAAAAEQAQQAEIRALHEKNTAEKAELDNEWGQRAPENYEFARRAARQFFPAEKAQDVIAAMESVLGYKGTVQLLHGIGKGLGEHDATVGMGNATSGAKRSAAQILYGSNQQ
jgi:hypothetical protein